MEAPFAPSLFVEIRKRMGPGVFEIFQGAITDAVEDAKAKRKSRSQAKRKDQPEDDDPPSATGGPPREEEPEHRGKLILDATVSPQAIRYPTDLSLLNEAREFSETIMALQENLWVEK